MFYFREEEAIYAACEVPLSLKEESKFPLLPLAISMEARSVEVRNEEYSFRKIQGFLRWS